MAYEIVNYPLSTVSRKGPAARFPIRQLQIGQSFWVPESEEKALRAAASHVNSKFHKWAIWVSVQKIEHEDGIVRVWCGRCDVPTERIVYKARLE